MPSRLLSFFILILLISVLVLITYHQIIAMDLFSDDIYWIKEVGRQPLGVEQLMSFHSTRRVPLREWRPLTNLTFGLCWRFFHEDARFYHGLSLLAHASCSVLVYFLGWIISRRRLPSVLAALLFAVGTASWEAVAWISALSSLLMANFYLGSILAWHRFLARGSRPALAACMTLAMMAMFTKESAITLPLVLIIFALIFHFYRNPDHLSRSELLKRVLALAPLLVLWTVYPILRLWLQTSGSWEPPLSRSILKNLMSLPHCVAVMGGVETDVHPDETTVLLASGILVILLIIAAVSSKNATEKRIYLQNTLFLVFFSLITFMPPAFFADQKLVFPSRYFYLMSAPVSLLFSLSLERVSLIISGNRRKISAILTILIFAFFIFIGYCQVQQQLSDFPPKLRFVDPSG